MELFYCIDTVNLNGTGHWENVINEKQKWQFTGFLHLKPYILWAFLPTLH